MKKPITNAMIHDAQRRSISVSPESSGAPLPQPTDEDMLELYNLGLDVEKTFQGITRKNTSADSWSIRQELLAAWQPLARKIKALRAEFVPEVQEAEGAGGDPLHPPELISAADASDALAMPGAKTKGYCQRCMSLFPLKDGLCPSCYERMATSAKEIQEAARQRAMQGAEGGDK